MTTKILVSSTQVFAKETFTFKMTSFGKQPVCNIVLWCKHTLTYITVGDSFIDENVNVFPEDEKS